MKKILLSLGVLALFSSSSFAGSLLGIGGDLEVYYINQNISGWVQHGKNGTKYDVKNNLGYDNKGSYGVKLSVDNPTGIFFVPNFGFEYVKVDFGGGNSYLKLNHYDFIFSWNFIKNDKVDLRMGAAIRGIKYDVQIDPTNKKKEDIWVPMFYMSVKASPATWIDFIFSEKVMSYSGNNYTDLNVEARFYPVNAIFKPFVSIGYKNEAISPDDTKGISATITLNQPYIGVGMAF